MQQLPSHPLHQNIYRKWSFVAWQHFMSHKLCLINGSKDVTQSCLEIIARWSPAENKYCLKTTVVSSDEVSIWMLRTDSSNSWTLRFLLSRVRGATGWHEVICISMKASSDASRIAWGLGEDRGFSLHDGHTCGGAPAACPFWVRVSGVQAPTILIGMLFGGLYTAFLNTPGKYSLAHISPTCYNSCWK